MAALRAEDIYERYVKSLSSSEQMRLLSLLTKGVAHQDEGENQENLLDITGLHGLGKEIWQGIDAQEYVDQLRSEWDQRP